MRNTHPPPPTPSTAALRRTHYIVRIGNVGLARTFTPRSPNHWHYLSPQHLWGLPRSTPQVNVRAEFEADIADPRTTAYVWFLSNSHGGPGHFVQVGVGQRHLGHGPEANSDLPIPADVMARLQQGFDHWFGWAPLSVEEGFLEELGQLEVPRPAYIPTLRRVTADHDSFARFEALVEREEGRAAPVAVPAAVPAFAVQSALPAYAIQAAVPRAIQSAVPAAVPTPLVIEADLENVRREQREPHAHGHVYLIHMEGTTFYKIGMSLDPQIRLRTLQTGNPHPLYLLTTQEVPDMRSAEMSLHQRFDDQRVPNLNVREWFDFGGGVGKVEMAFGMLG